MSQAIRPLHFVFKIGARTASMNFYQKILKMGPLRHEEFLEGCDAACNGPYDGKWSKTMIGYGDEHKNFVLELTYNYGIREYERGNDFKHIRVLCSRAFDAIKDKQAGWPHKLAAENDGGAEFLEVVDPSGYTFLVGKQSKNQTQPQITEVSLHSTDLAKSVHYWDELLGDCTRVTERDDTLVKIAFDGKDYDWFRLNLVKVNHKVEHSKAYGRIAFACPTAALSGLQAKMDAEKQSVLTRLVSLDTPGKASVSVVILGDSDGHEICFVGDEGFRELSAVDPQAQTLLDKAVADDKSDLWHEKQEEKREKQKAREQERQQQQQQQQQQQ